MARLNVKGMSKVTPAGLGQWVKVNDADDYGNLTADLLLNPSDKDVKVFLAMIDEMVDKVEAEVGKGKAKYPYKEDEEGNILFKAKVKAVDKDGNPNSVDLVDTLKNDIKGTAVGNGSKIKLLVWLNPYDMGGNYGVSARLKKVQVIDLVEYGEDFGTEDGYTGSPISKEAQTAMTDDEDF